MKGFDFMEIRNIVNYLEREVEKEEYSFTITKTFYRINHNYTYYYYDTYKSAVNNYIATVGVICNWLEDEETPIEDKMHGMCTLEEINLDYDETYLSAREIYEQITHNATQILHFEY